MSRNQDLYDAIFRGDKNIVEQIAKKAALQGADVICLLTESMIPAMDRPAASTSLRER